MRYIPKNEINFSNIGRELGVSRQTISKKFNNLIEMQLISQQGDNYVLCELPHNMAYLIPKSTLKILTDTMKEKTVSTYVYLFNRYIINDEKPYMFTLNAVKQHVGLSNKTSSNNEIVINILIVLQALGLIKYELVTVTDEWGNVKTIYQINEVCNEIQQK